MFSVVLNIFFMSAILKTEESGVFFEIEDQSFLLSEGASWNGTVVALLSFSQMYAREPDYKSAKHITEGGNC